ncbi:presenilin-like protein At1g08700 [Asparagus officinalis]|uniref:presenilin-like protein At1g08700 n=1 Tax=Asparagus officinalis TaxID=4686 RepID=UPI00098E736B|nr:presenilin-like protein At1g08700 [Asparagus officinalis]
MFLLNCLLVADEELTSLVYEARPTAQAQPDGWPPALATVATAMSVEMQLVTSTSGVSCDRSFVVDIEDAAVVAATAEVEEEERAPLFGDRNAGEGNNDDDDDDSMEMSRGIRLGLGDFVFYCILVGRAAIYDLMTVYACYLVILSGLGCTLILLTVWRRALSALPISIMLGVAFYFLTRLLMEPFVVGASTNLVRSF